MKFILFTILLLGVLLEAAFLTIPLVVGLCLFLTILFQEKFMIVFVVLFGILLDVLTFHAVGASSLFLISCIGLMYLYKRKFEIQSLGFVGISIFISTLGYSVLFGRFYPIFGAFICALFFVGVYILLETLQHKHARIRTNMS